MAVVVAYLPDTSVLHQLLQSLLKQVDEVLIVDNTPAADDRVHAAIADFLQLLSTLRLIRVGRNVGVGAALNIGIQAAMDEDFEYVLLSDQDSLPAPDMVKQLLTVARQFQASGVRFGYVGAAYIDQNTGRSVGFEVQEPGRFFYSWRAGDDADPWIEVTTGITSGSLHPCRVFADVGLMHEDWFIDYLDTEWFHRARYRGYRMFGTSRAVLSHRLGESTFRVWKGRWCSYNDYPPQRLYYRFRNFVLLMRCAHVPWMWKARACRYYVSDVYAYLLFSPNRVFNFKSFVRALWDGLRGKEGVMEEVCESANTQAIG